MLLLTRLRWRLALRSDIATFIALVLCWGCVQFILLANFTPAVVPQLMSSEHNHGEIERYLGPDQAEKEPTTPASLMRSEHNHGQIERHLGPESSEKEPTIPDFDTITDGAPVCKAVNADDISFTLVTQLSDNRMWLMKHHCAKWKSDISLAVLTDRTSKAVEAELKEMDCHKVTLQILPRKDYKSVDYPVNTLRNLAIATVKTSHFLFIDADFWLSHRTDQILMMEAVRQTLSKDYRQALVIPAYSLRYNCKNRKDPTSCRKEKIPLMPKTKVDLVVGMKKGIVTMFDPKNPGGHGTTHYDLWAAQRTGSVETIPCSKSPRYEPYLVVQRCRELPPCQEKFTGYGMNKIAWILHLRRKGYIFSQVGGAFLVHYPHPESDARKLWMKKSGVGLREKVDGIFEAFKSWLNTLPDEQRFSDCPLTKADNKDAKEKAPAIADTNKDAKEKAPAIADTNKDAKEIAPAIADTKRTEKAPAQNDRSPELLTFERFTRGAPKCKAVDPDDIAFTLVTQLSDDRLWLMQHHCSRWGSAISLAVLTDRKKESVKADLESMGCKGITLDIVPQKNFKAEDYPVNILRNLAMSGVNTSHFFYIDADFWTSRQTDEMLKSKSVLQALSKDPKQALVVPAFMLYNVCLKKKNRASCEKKLASLMPQAKRDLLKGLDDGIMTVFDSKNRDGHGSTMHNLWVGQPEGSLEPIQCIHSDRYEPYIVAQYCHDLPPCQDRFIGYGKDKLEWIMHLRWAGYSFAQVGGAFLCHYPHKDSEWKKMWAKKKAGARRDRAEAGKEIFSNFTAWLHALPDNHRVPLCPVVTDT